MDAARLAGIALAGATFQILLTGVVRWPEALRAQRAQLAVVFRELATLARGTPDASGVPSAEAADAAQELISGTSLLARDDGTAMRGLLDAARRIRLTLIALAGLRRQMAPELAAVATDVNDLLREVAGVLDSVATALTGRHAAAIELLGEQPTVSRSAHELPASIGDRSMLTGTAVDVRHVAGLLRAVDTLVDEIWQSGRLRLRLPTRRRGRRRRWGERLRSNVAQLHANLSPQSAPFRHATRMAVLVCRPRRWPASTRRWRALYWIPVTVAVVLRPDFTGTSHTRCGADAGNLDRGGHRRGRARHAASRPLGEHRRHRHPRLGNLRLFMASYAAAISPGSPRDRRAAGRS